MSISSKRLLQKVGAEMIGTFALVFFGCGAIMIDRLLAGALTHVGIAATFGLVIMVMVYATGHISGAHFNPAVTFAFAVVGRFPWRHVPTYAGGQILGALLAAWVLRAVLGDVGMLGATLPAGSAAQSLVLEIVTSFFLMFVITAVATDSRALGQMAGLAIGGTVALAAMFAGPISGASMNPSRTLGPAIAGMTFDSLWIYMIGPALGATCGALAYRAIRCSETGERSAGGCC